MDHWRAVLPLPIYESAYEELVGDFESHVLALIAHCGLEWNDRCASASEARAFVRTRY